MTSTGTYLDELVAQVERALALLDGGLTGRAEVLDARQALAELAREAVRFHNDHGEACRTIAEMHAAATGRVGGPIRGVVEDIAELRAAGQRLADYVLATPQPDRPHVEELVDRWNHARGAYPDHRPDTCGIPGCSGDLR